MVKIEGIKLPNGTSVEIDTATGSIQTDGDLIGHDIRIGSKNTTNNPAVVVEASGSGKKKKDKKTKMNNKGDDNGEIRVGGGIDASSSLIIGHNMKVNRPGIHIGESLDVQISETKSPSKTKEYLRRYVQMLAKGQISFADMFKELEADTGISLTFADMAAKYDELTKDIPDPRPLREIGEEVYAAQLTEYIAIRKELREIRTKDGKLSKENQEIWDAITKILGNDESGQTS